MPSLDPLRIAAITGVTLDVVVTRPAVVTSAPPSALQQIAPQAVQLPKYDRDITPHYPGSSASVTTEKTPLSRDLTHKNIEEWAKNAAENVSFFGSNYAPTIYSEVTSTTTRAFTPLIVPTESEAGSLRSERVQDARWEGRLSIEAGGAQDAPTQVEMTVKRFNVLVLGETQSGKSTLLEALKLYANPTYKINSSRIGSGNVSLTTEVRQESIYTRLPEYLVKKVDRFYHPKLQSKVQHPVAYDVFIKKDKDTYEDELNARREYQPPVQGNSWTSNMLKFNIIDTPGLNDAKDQDEDHVFKIISELGGQSLDLVLVTVSRGAFTQGLQQVLRSYMDLFPQLGDIMAFVHTRVDYLELHPDMTNFQSYMNEKMATLSTIMGRPSFPHFWIDCDFETTKPVRKCITNNTLRRMLRLAVENKSVVILHSKTLNKTPKMKEIDRIIKNQVQAVIQAIEKTLEFNDKDEGVLLQGVYIRATEINELQAKINILQDLQQSYQIDELGLLYEERFDDIQQPLAMGVSQMTHYAGEHTIDDAVVWCENFKFYGLDGKQSSKSWQGTFEKKTQDYNGYYHIKLYAKKSSRFKAEIDDIAMEIADLEVQLQRMVNESALQPKEALSKIQSFVDAHNRHIEVIRLASADTLSHDLFVELVNDKAFAGPTNKSSEKVAAVYRTFAHRRFLNINKPPPSPQARFAWTP
ncbi:MAG: hypothetical protein J3R72DRAFT_479844 [Linnemannia gamsii]|nr:MAG: hypothetical protein J3R72DRAFT_479844 [Linnemannia gamsii]